MAIDSIKVSYGGESKSQKFLDLGANSINKLNNDAISLNGINMNYNSMGYGATMISYSGNAKELVDNLQNIDVSIVQGFITLQSSDYNYEELVKNNSFSIYATHDYLNPCAIVHFPQVNIDRDINKTFILNFFEGTQLNDLDYLRSQRAPQFPNQIPAGSTPTGDYLVSFAVGYDQLGTAYLIECIHYQDLNKCSINAFTTEALTRGMLVAKENHWQTAEWGRWETVELSLVDGSTSDYGSIAKTNPYKSGSYDDSSDIIEKAPMPTKSYCANGCGTLYVVDDLKSIMGEIFPDIKEVSSITDIPEAIGNLFELQQSEILKKYIVDVICVPFHVESGSATNIKLGWKTLQTLGKPLRSEYIDVDLGTYTLPLYYGNFLDIEATTIKLFLPFYGFVDINSELLNGGTIGVEYRWNVLTGDFIIWVRCYSAFSTLKGICQQYTGNASIHFPLNAVNYQNQVNGMIQSAINTTGGIAKVVGGVGTNSGDAVLNGANDIVSGVMQGASAKPTASSSNAYSSSAGYLSIRKPFLLIDRQVPHFSPSYPSEIGIPSYVNTKLSNTSGFNICQVDDVAIERATKEELEEIVMLMRRGIIL